MRNYPQPGERWQHERGWTVTIIRLTEASPSVALVNPEFSCEVLIRHDSDNKLSALWHGLSSGIRACLMPRSLNLRQLPRGVAALAR